MAAEEEYYRLMYHKFAECNPKENQKYYYLIRTGYIIYLICSSLLGLIHLFPYTVFRVPYIVQPIPFHCSTLALYSTSHCTLDSML